jgi:PAS domain-containing protein
VVRDAQGKILAGLIIVADISERKKNEEALRSSDAAFRAIKEGIVITDSKFLITDWNDSIEHITGVQSSEAIGKHIFNVVEILNPLPSDIRKQYSILEENDFAGYLSYEILIRLKMRHCGLRYSAGNQECRWKCQRRLFIVTAINERKKLEKASGRHTT